ncbi:MAG TPA: TetR/AcrR family transcriptional regulator [Allosphingosinicella sp.]|nr:TetR/AcrR family transcriptional regulator [Allosphingosinicella sp.]
MAQKATSEAVPRGRPRSFDTDEVLGRVRDIFWRHGFAGTSMDQLSAATGLHKPSLYGAFGDKRKLFLAVLNNYLAELGAAFAEAFARPDLFESLEAMIEVTIDKFTQSDSGSGCFMMSTALPEAAADPELSAVVRGALESLERAFLRRFQKAIEAGQIPADADAQALAMIMGGGHSEISARARAGYTREELRETGRRTLALIRKLTAA